MNYDEWTEEEKLAEIKKCTENHYYFCTKHIKDFKTPLSEEEFNKMFNELLNAPIYLAKRRGRL